MNPRFTKLLQHFRSPRVITIAACVLTLGVFSGMILKGPIQRGVQEIAYMRIGGGIPVYTPDPRQSKKYNQFGDWLFNDIAKQKEPWDVELAGRLMMILDARYTDEQDLNVARHPDATWRDQEPIMYYMDTESVLAERLRRNEPIDPDARRMLVMALTDALEDPYARIRLHTISSVCYARLVKDPEIRAKVEAMFDDPDESVASNARRQLAHFDNIERLRAEGKWHEPWIKD